MSDTNLCPCGTQQNLTDCCLPVIQGARTAKTAEELLRARYTAFTQGTVDFILSSHHSRTRNDVKRDEIEDWSKNSEWLGLKIVECQQGQANDSKGEIIFSATYRPKGKTAKEKTEEHWEKSFFEKENGHWKFLDAQGVQVGTYRRTQPKVGRNDPCSCGSNKKYKKCCGANNP